MHGSPLGPCRRRRTDIVTNARLIGRDAPAQDVPVNHLIVDGRLSVVTKDELAIQPGDVAADANGGSLFGQLALVDGVLVTDLPPEEAEEWIAAARRADLDTVFLAAPTSPPERLRRVAEASRGFVYAVSRTGVTGERQALSDEAQPLVERLHALTDVPVALGFGLSTPEQVAAAAQAADGVVVGSALVRFLEKEPDGDVGEQVRWLTSAIRP